MERLLAIKIKIDENTYSSAIPISTLAEEVFWDSGHNYTLKDIIGTIKTETIDSSEVLKSIQSQLNELSQNKVSIGEIGQYITNDLEEDIDQWLPDLLQDLIPDIDDDLVNQGQAADAKAVGDAITTINGTLDSINDDIDELQNKINWNYNDSQDQTSLNRPAIKRGTGTDSTIENSATTASGDDSHAEGHSTTASGVASHAEGYGATASGDYSHVEGYNTTANGDYSHTEGIYTETYGESSHAEGEGTIARRKAQHVFGTYNEADSEGTASTIGDYVEIVGNGTADNARSNARTLDWNGNEVLAGKLTVGIAPTNNMDVATKKYVDDIDTVNDTIINGIQNNITSIQNTLQGINTATNEDVNKILAVKTVSGGKVTEWQFKTAAQSGVSDYMDLINRPTLVNGTGTGAILENNATAASGNYSHAEGSESSAGGIASHSQGYQTNAISNCSHAEGENSTASGVSAHAEGHNTTAAGNYSHTEGQQTATYYQLNSQLYKGNCAHAEGFNTVASGPYSHAEGTGTKAFATGSHAEGSGCVAEGHASHAEGSTTRASQEGSHAEGKGTTASVNYSHAEGSGTTASGIASHTEGFYATASGNYSHAEGNDTTASGGSSHAEGFETVASGGASHAEGRETTALGENSHTEGYLTKSYRQLGNRTYYGNYAHAEGQSTTASGVASHAEGRYTIAVTRSQHVFGEYNTIESIQSSSASSLKGEFVQIVGNGTGDNNRSNARTLDWDGNESLAGTLTLGKGTANETTLTAAQFHWVIKTESSQVTTNSSGLIHLQDNFGVPSNAFGIICNCEDLSYVCSGVSKFTQGQSANNVWYAVLTSVGSATPAASVTTNVTCTWFQPKV